MFRRNKVVFLAALTFSIILLVHPAASSTPPVASFTYTPEKPILGDIIVFNASKSYDPDGGKISSYKWNFDDGTPLQTVADPVITHNYTVEGTYNVNLTVTDDEGEKSFTLQSVTVREYPVAVFTYKPAYPIVGQAVTFNASLSTGDGGSIVSYEWNFKDGNTTKVNFPVITHVYATHGNYNVTLKITDSENLTDTTWAVVPVRDYPVANFTWSPQRPLVNEVVTFNASSSTPKGGTIKNYTWNFADSNITTVTNPVITHVYKVEKIYNVTLTVADSEGLTGSCSKSVWVRKLPVASFTYSPAAPLVNQTVTFNASLSTPNGGTIVSYTWKFGDGSPPVTEADPIISHTYKNFGTFNVTLTIKDSEDLTDNFTDTIRILIKPVAKFTYSPTWPVVNETVTFNASASYDPDASSSIVSYRWDFRDGNVTTVNYKVITHRFKVEDTYNVTLTVTDDDGLTNTVWKLITVYTFLYVHDIAITSVTTPLSEVYVGQMVNITVVAKNEGTAVETFNVTVCYDATSIGKQVGIILLPGKEKVLTFSWLVTALPGRYTISAQATLVPGIPPETDTADNTRDYTIKVKMEGDVSGDGIVDIEDIVIVAIAFESRPGQPDWNPIADLNFDGIIDIADVVTAAIHFGERL